MESHKTFGKGRGQGRASPPLKPCPFRTTFVELFRATSCIIIFTILSENAQRDSVAMMLVSLHDKVEIEAFIRQDPLRYIFELGDLNDFFWPYTNWYAHKVADTIQQLVLVYFGLSPPILLANPTPPEDQMREL